jgi:signal transduction histidine kinase
VILMLAKLRRRFILITMGLVGLILLIVLAASVISSYQTTASGIERALYQSVSQGPNDEQRLWIGGQESGSLLELLLRLFGQSPEGTSPRQGEHFIPVYIAILDPSSSTLLGDNSAFIRIDPSLANAAIDAVMGKLPQRELVAGENRSGLLLDLRLFYRAEVLGSGGVAFAFADASKLLDDTLLMVGVSALIWLGAMLALFFISLLLSRIVTRPVAEAWERQRRFVADASHELKTPLTVILANNSLLTAHPDKTVAEQAQWIQSTQSEAQRMDNLVRDLLLLAQTDEGKKRPKSSMTDLPPVNLSALLDHSLLQFEAVFFERNVDLTSEIAANVTVRGDAEQLGRLVQILLDNASKYAAVPTAGTRATVHVGLREGQGNGVHALLEITNSGDPIAPEALPHLFERFFRADAAHSNTEGAGLGLSLAQAIATAHHGSITVASTPTNTTFTVTL